MLIESLRYDLGPENIAAEPPEVRLGRRDLGRMLVVDRKKRTMRHAIVRDLLRLLAPGDAFVINNSKRIPGVLFGRTEQGSQVELRFAGLSDAWTGDCRIYPAHGVAVGTSILTEDGNRLSVDSIQSTPHVLHRVRAVAKSLEDTLRANGLPITSFFSNGYWSLDNYNPVYAEEEGSIESPMAGIHLTAELLETLRARGIRVVTITLHSVGSWLPFVEDQVDNHQMHEEKYKISAEAAEAIRATREAGGRIFACGSTVLRTLESAAENTGDVIAGAGATSLYIRPGYSFRIVNAYFTNFHTYRSSLMVLDAAVCERSLLMRAYRHAQRAGYLFHEFGDAVLYV